MIYSLNTESLFPLMIPLHMADGLSKVILPRQPSATRLPIHHKLYIAYDRILFVDILFLSGCRSSAIRIFFLVFKEMKFIFSSGDKESSVGSIFNSFIMKRNC